MVKSEHSDIVEAQSTPMTYSKRGKKPKGSQNILLSDGGLASLGSARGSHASRTNSARRLQATINRAEGERGDKVSRRKFKSKKNAQPEGPYEPYLRLMQSLPQQ